MLVVEAQETIARFIGLFRTQDIDPGIHARLASGQPHRLSVDPRRSSEAEDEGHAGGIARPGFDPRIRLQNDRFEIEEAATHRLAAPGVDLALHPHGFGAARLLPSVPESSAGIETAGAGLRDPSILYRAIPSDQLFAIQEQVGLLDDRDVLVLGEDVEPLSVVDAVTREFEAMLDAARAAQSLPGIPHTPTELRDILRATATPEGEAPSATGAATGHEGIFVDGARVDTAPDLDALIEAVRPDEAPDDGLPRLDTGSNLSANQAALLNVGHLGAVSVVKGDWFETNSIRQINIHSDRDVVEGLGEAMRESVADTTRTLNVARFERTDATPGPEPLLDPRSALPAAYRVDVIEGDLEIANFLRQVKLTLDGDQVVLSAMQSTVTATLGGNESFNVASLAKLLGAYDLVIVGGSVYEGNFIQQINLLQDSDRIRSEVADAEGPGVAGSVSTSGNLLVNHASITNVGAVSDFAVLSPEMRGLVSAFEARLASGSADLGADLAFLGAAGIRVLYVTGDVIEMNVVSQINILDDADTVRMSDGMLARVQHVLAPDAQWTVSTGGNVLLNDARIVDADDAGATRFVGGEYYSGSMLLQAGLVSSGPDLQVFDTAALAPEVVAFVSDIQGEGAFHGADAASHSASNLVHDASADGVGGILS